MSAVPLNKIVKRLFPACCKVKKGEMLSSPVTLFTYQEQISSDALKNTFVNFSGENFSLSP